jgi:Fuc2NAc and GlcNAc transferase
VLELCIFSGAFLVTYFGVAWFRRWSLKRGVLDQPNERSSHSAPTPRGGGLVVALVVLTVYVCASFIITYDVSWSFVAGALLILAVSWLDDMYSLSFVWRLLAHSLAAVLVIYYIGYVSSFPLPNSDQAFEIGSFGAVLTFCWIVWLVNAYNFMDGIDGIAGLQALTAGIGWLVVGIDLGLPVLYILGGTVVFACGAFLLHNWPPARIFMGDAGSAFLGFVFAVFPLLARSENGASSGYLFMAGVLFVWLFVFDSVVTFFRRLLRGERVWLAHREHLYQRLVLSGYSHRRTTVIYGTVSVLIAVTTAIWLTKPQMVPFYVLGSIILVASGALLLLCRNRKCLTGKIS